MKKKIAILGSTSSIGKSLLRIVEKNKKNFKIELLTANTNYKDLINQANKYKVKIIDKIIIMKNPLTETSSSKTNQNREKVPPVSSTMKA